MSRINFEASAVGMPFVDAAVLLPNEEPYETFLALAADSVASAVNVTVGGVTMSLAAWTDPHDYEADCELAGLDPDDVEAFIAGQAVETREDEGDHGDR